ncbi:DB module [Ancylostoma caninum]|uniref:DB module n=1 Tax=Ancylostoma caninum TaxID=29170 RepID=A0A368FJI1_ANCCA|nr:DB module [Ancylostoma caninum]
MIAAMSPTCLIFSLSYTAHHANYCAITNKPSFQLGSSLGLKCLSQLTTWAYCAADATDQTTCCSRRGVTSECLSFCKGDVPTCDTQSILNYQPCTQHMAAIVQCQKEGLGPKPKYDPNWSSVCEWEGK